MAPLYGWENEAQRGRVAHHYTANKEQGKDSKTVWLQRGLYFSIDIMRTQHKSTTPYLKSLGARCSSEFTILAEFRKVIKHSSML